MTEKISYNYSKLLGKLREHGITQGKLAEMLGKNESTISSKLSGKFYFTVEEIDAICELLNIGSEEIGIYFFAK